MLELKHDRLYVYKSKACEITFNITAGEAFMLQNMRPDVIGEILLHAIGMATGEVPEGSVGYEENPSAVLARHLMSKKKG